jgi:DNA-binding XRE family transcriptional regulator
MPYKSGKIIIANTENDRRIKLTIEDKELVKWLREEEQISYQKLADKFGVSKRLIIFICKPETLQRCKDLRQERGGSKQYYEKENHRISQKEHRNYKQKLFIDGKINLPNEKNNRKQQPDATTEND